MTDELVETLYRTSQPAIEPRAGALRFAFWGRCSTEDMQEPESSKRWQRTLSEALIQPVGGEIVAEYFDIDESRSIPPQRRPYARELLAQLGNPDRGFDAVVVGEPQRAFYGNQFGNTIPVFDHYGVQMWVPEIGGPIDTANEAHEMIMNMYGGMSKGERNRDRIRVKAAMRDQARFEGRYLGGRPPYGYMLVDAGPHPNPRKAAEGRRLRMLVPDPVAAPVVRRIFADRLRGVGPEAIADRLNQDGIACPSAHDPARNSHRDGDGWQGPTVAVILTNPRYTGRQVWGRQRKDEVLIDVRDVTLGHTTRFRWNDPAEWVWSAPRVHEAIVDDETFMQVQALMRAREGEVKPRPRRSRHKYQFRTLMWCGLCDRRMEGSWNNGKPHYRCKLTSRRRPMHGVGHPTTVYVREELIAPEIEAWLASAFGPANVSATIDALVAAQSADASHQAEIDAARAEVKAAADKIDRYRSALDAGADPAVVSQWITDAQAQRLAAQQRLDAVTAKSQEQLSRTEIETMINNLGDLTAVLADADPDDKNQIYTDLGLTLTYQPHERKMIAQVSLDDHVLTKCPRGDLNPHALNGH